MAGILVVYGTKSGSTREVAEAVTAALSSGGVDGAVSPARGMKDPVGDRDLVVVGGAIYSGRWHRDASRLLKRHRRELDRTPVAVFGMGPRTQDEDAWKRSRAQLDRALARHSWLHTVAVTVLGGVDPPRRSDRPRRDARDWDAIQAWSEDLARLLTAMSPPTQIDTDD